MSTSERSPTRLDPATRVERSDGLVAELPPHPPALTPTAARLLLQLLDLDPGRESGPASTPDPTSSPTRTPKHGEHADGTHPAAA